MVLGTSKAPTEGCTGGGGGDADNVDSYEADAKDDVEEDTEEDAEDGPDIIDDDDCGVEAEDDSWVDGGVEHEVCADPFRVTA